MNERLYDLINQCFIATTEGKLSELNTVSNVEKFAELIVKECAGVNYNSVFMHGEFCAREVLEHFGIEEWTNES